MNVGIRFGLKIVVVVVEQVVKAFRIKPSIETIITTTITKKYIQPTKY